MVVLTQNILCKTIPKIKSKIVVTKKEVWNIYDIINAATIVMITSTIATPNNLYE
jgi:hypothetical protein